ncbi:glycosyltransferase [Actinomyces howellii]|uniref:Putative glycosyl transferase n=1 Tax=Actinomyces howellii TaxID=52771 RepID=A0A448HKR5_9ACTO|nr:glycosyltransferase [Actinomyces howellii]VEG30139.1 putative glycosyl transferase [Actinomyces howellii]
MADLQPLLNVLLLADTAVQHLGEDPLLLGVQSARRLPPPARAHLARAADSTDGLRHALAEFLRDRPDQARSALARSGPARGWRRRLGAALAVQLGDRGLVGGLEDQPPSLRALDLWSRGHLDQAVDCLAGVGPARSQRARLSAELAMMSPGFRLPDLSPSPAWRRAPQDGPTRVLHLLTNSVPWTASGYALRSHHLLRAQLAEGLEASAITRIGYPVTIGALGARSHEVVDSVHYRRLLPARLAPTLPARLVDTARLVSAHVEHDAPHVLHTTTNYHNALVARSVARSYGIPWVYEMRGALEMTWVASRRDQDEALASQRFAALRAKETEMALSADAVITLSRVHRDELVARGVPAERIHVVPNAVEDRLPSSRPVSPGRARRALGLPDQGWWVGSVSSMVAYEGLDLLVRAVARCRAEGLDVRCLLVGDGVSRPGLEALARDLGLGPQECVLPGRVPHEQAHRWYSALDVFCVPRLDTPVCRVVTPLKPMTAMALGRPVLVSDLPALREVADRGPSAVFGAGSLDSLVDALVRAHREGIPGTAGADLPTWGGAARSTAGLYEVLR